MVYQENGGAILAPQPRHHTQLARKNGTVAESDTLNTSSLLQAAQLMWEQDFAAPSPSMVGHRPASNQHPVGPYDHSVHAQHSQRSQHGISASMPATRAPSPVHEYPSFASTTVSPQGSRPLTPQEEGSFSFAGYTTTSAMEQNMPFPKSKSKPATPKPTSAPGAWGAPSAAPAAKPTATTSKASRPPPSTKVTPKPSFLERRHSTANQQHAPGNAAQATSHGKTKRRRASVADTRNEDRLESKKVFSVYDETRHHRILNLMRKGTVPKCRAVYGMNDKQTWCRQCRYKKACTRSEFFHRDMLNLVERESISFPMTPVSSTSPVGKTSPSASTFSFARDGQEMGLTTLIDAKLIFPGDTLHCLGQTALLSREGIILSSEGNYTCPQQWALHVTRNKGKPTAGVNGWASVTLRSGITLEQIRRQNDDMVLASKGLQTGSMGVKQEPQPLTPAGSRSESDMEEDSPKEDA